MATKPRHLKTPTQLWIADNRKRLGLTPADLAALTGVTEDTARAWESRGKPSQDALDILVRRFGVKAPEDTASPTVDASGLAAIAAAIDRQTAVLSQLIERLPPPRDELDEIADREIARAEGRLAAEKQPTPWQPRTRGRKRPVAGQQ